MSLAHRTGGRGQWAQFRGGQKFGGHEIAGNDRTGTDGEIQPTSREHVRSDVSLRRRGCVQCVCSYRCWRLHHGCDCQPKKARQVQNPRRARERERAVDPSRGPKFDLNESQERISPLKRRLEKSSR